jgi:hypothetical protein
MKIFQTVNLVNFYLLVLVLPIFIDQSGRVLNLGLKASIVATSATALPIGFLFGLIILPILFFMWWKKKMGLLPLFFNTVLDKLVWGTFLFMIVSFIIGSIIYQSFDVTMFFIYFGPFVVGYLLGNYSGLIMTSFYFLNRIIAIIPYVAFGHIVSSYLELGVLNMLLYRGSHQVFNFFTIYQKYIYYPYLLAIIVFVYLVYFSRSVQVGNKIYFGICFFILYIDIIIVAAREAILITILFPLFFLCFRADKKVMLHGLLIILFVLPLCIFLILYYQIDVSDITLLSKFLKMGGSESLSGVSAVAGARDIMIENMLRHSLTFNLIFGQFFILHPSLYFNTPHNMFFEWYIRGSFLYCLLNVLIFIRGIFNFWKLRNENLIYLIFFLLLIITFFISFNINTHMRAPLSSTFIWTIIGFGNSKYYLLRRRELVE